MTIELEVDIEEDVVVCVQEGIPLPNFVRYNDKNACLFSFTFKATIHPTTTGHTTTGKTTTGHTTTGKITTGPVVTSTTGKTTTSTTSTTSGKLTTTTVQPTTSNNAKAQQLKRLSSGGKGVSFKNLLGGKQSYSFPVRALSYYVGVYYSNPSSANHKAVPVLFTLSGKYCNNGKTGSDCSIEIKDFAAQNVTSGSTAYFKYVVNPSGDAYSNITFEIKGKTTNFSVTGRFSGIPSTETHDWTGNTYTLLSPKPGNYYFQVLVTVDTEVSGTAHISYCQNHTAGSDCSIPIVNSSSLNDKFELTKIEKAGQVKLYAIYNVAMKSLLVTLYDIETDKNAKVAASYNRVPTYDSVSDRFDADIIGCNTEFCNKVQAINTKDAVMNQDYLYDTNNGTWYVAIKASRDANEFYVWFDNVCPGNCTGQGTCGSTGDDYGICN